MNRFLTSLLLLAAVFCPRDAFPFINPEAEFAEWISRDTPEHREAIARWSEDFLRSTLSFKDSQYLRHRPIKVGWDYGQGELAQATYNPKSEFPYVVKLSASHWFKEGHKDGTGSWDILAFALLHERYHMFCRRHGDDWTGAKQLMPVLQRLRKNMGNGPMAPHTLTRLHNMVHAIEEFHANAYAKKEYEQVVGFQGLQALRKLHKFNIGFTNNWSETLIDVPPWQAYAMNEISKRLGFDAQYIQDDLNKPDTFDRMAKQIAGMPESESCRWLENPCVTVSSNPGDCLSKP